MLCVLQIVTVHLHPPTCVWVAKQGSAYDDKPKGCRTLLAGGECISQHGGGTSSHEKYVFAAQQPQLAYVST